MHPRLLFRLTFLLSGLFVFALAGFASDPVWWAGTGTGTPVVNASFTGNTHITNHAPLNLGQLKNTAYQAMQHLNQQLANLGGAGPGITALVNGFNATTIYNYAPANLGQLKAVAQPFYDRLVAIGYNTTLNLQQRGYSSTYTGIYPWNPSTPTSANYAPANLGQLKMVFSFDLSLSAADDTDGDGLPDWWEMAYYGTLGEGFSTYANFTGVLAAYAAGTVPPLPTMTVVITAPQSGQSF
jgi:hypothetical protein